MKHEGEFMDYWDEMLAPEERSTRADRARKVIELYSNTPGIAAESAEAEEAVLDLLADLGHFCDEHKINLYDLEERAREHHLIENGTMDPDSDLGSVVY